MENEKGLNKLIDNLKSKDPLQRIDSAFELAKMGIFEHIEIIATELINDNWSIRAQAINYLGRIGSRHFINMISKHLEEKVIDNRNVALYALQKIGTPSVIPLLFRSLKDQDPDIREDAKTALYRVLGKTILPVLYEEDELKMNNGENVEEIYDKALLWWKNNSMAYDPKSVYAYGKLASPDVLINMIAKSQKVVPDAFINQLEDLTGFLFEKPRSKAIYEWQSWLKENGKYYEPGKKYFYSYQVDQ